MATLNTSHPLVVNGKLKFLAVFDEGTGVPEDLVSGESASAIGTTPGWTTDPEQGFAADLTANGAWLWSGFTHGIDDTSISMLARFNLQSTVTWGGILGLDYLGHGTTLYHHDSDHMAFDNTGGGGHETSTLPWVNGEWHNGLLTIDIAGDNISYFRDGTAGVDEALTIGGTLADDDDITVGVGQWADNWCNGYVGLAAIFSPALTAEEAEDITADPYSLIASAGATGTIAQVIPAVLQALTGTETITGAVAQITPAVTQALTGTSLLNATSTIAQTIAAATQALTGTSLVNLTGTIGQVIPPVTQALTAAQTFTGTIVQTITAVTQSLTGGQTISGAISQTIAAARQALTGAQTISGSIAQTIASVTQSISGTTTTIFTGSIAQTIGRVVQSLSATTGWPGVVRAAKHAHRAIMRSR